MRTRRYIQGVSLVEILIVLMVVALLATMVISVAGRIDAQAKEKSVESLFVLLEGALQEYREFMDHFPEQTEINYANAVNHSEYLYNELQSIPGAQKILQKIDESLIKNQYSPAGVPLPQTGPEIYDPWGTPLDYRYVAGNNFPVLVSAGPDKTFATADDMNNR